MMKVSDALQAAWAAAAAEAGSLPGYYSRRLDETGPLVIYGGIDTPGSLRNITVRIPGGRLVWRSLADSTRGYDVTEEAKSPDRPNDIVVHVRESGSQVPKDLFLIFCSDVVEHIARCKTVPEGARMLETRLRHWRRFFQARSDEGLTREEYIGLYAELDFLARCLKASVPADTLVKAWTGPLGTNQDYLFGPTAVEVKATIGNDPDVVRVTNARQLDSTGLDRLVLAHAAYDFRKDAGQPLRALVSSLRACLKENDEALISFEERLAFAGFTHPERGSFIDFGFTSRNRRYFTVDNRFPRILESSLEAGISDIAYSIHLSAAVACSMNEPAVISLLGGG